MTRTELNVKIRPYRIDDAETVFNAARESMAELQPWMPWCHQDYSLEDSQSWLELQVPAFAEGDAFEFAIISEDDRYLGGCGLNQIDKLNKRANLGYWVRTSAAGHGVATQAVSALRDWAFENTDLIRLEVLIAVDNIASLRVADKTGALKEGVLRRRLVLNGKAHDATLFSFTRDIPKTND